MKPLNLRDLADPVKVRYITEWEKAGMVQTLTKLKKGQDVVVGMICDPCELNDV